MIKNKNIDKYKALWISHSAMGDFMKCPRLYYLKSIYKDKYGRKIDIPSPYKSLGIAIHETVEALANIPTENRIKEIENNLLNNFQNNWNKYKGQLGGFRNIEEENDFYNRGLVMINNIIANNELFRNKIIPKSSYYDGPVVPNVVISTDPDILLCGSIDWLRYNDNDKTISIIDFKTGKYEESEDSLQLFIYYYLLKELQRMPIRELYYMYLNNSAKEEDMKRIDIADYKDDEEYFLNKILDIANQILEKKRNNDWSCPNNNCIHCAEYENIINGKAEYIGIGSYNKSIYIINKE